MKTKTDDRAHAFLRWLYLPSLALVVMPAFMIARSLTFHNYAHDALFAQNDSYRAAFGTGFILAALLAFWPKARQAIIGHF